MKKLMTIALLLIGSTAFAQKNPLDGTWKQTNREHLSGLEIINSIPQTITFKTEKGQLLTERTMLTGDPNAPELVQKETLDLSGKPVKSLTEDKETFILTAKLSADKRSLSRSGNRSEPHKPESTDASSTEEWILSADGKTLTLTRTLITKDGEEDRSDKGTYSKQD